MQTKQKSKKRCDNICWSYFLVSGIFENCTNNNSNANDKSKNAVTDLEYFLYSMPQSTLCVQGRTFFHPDILSYLRLKVTGSRYDVTITLWPPQDFTFSISPHLFFFFFAFALISSHRLHPRQATSENLHLIIITVHGSRRILEISGDNSVKDMSI